MTYILWETLGLLVYNLLVALLYGMDKWKAERGAWRIPEKVLLILAFLLGGAGAAVGMILFHHKSAKWKFRLLVPLALLLNLAAFVLFFMESAGGVGLFV